MPRPAINLDPYRLEISQLYLAGETPDSIALNLAAKYQISVTAPTIKVRLRTWGIRKQNRTAARDEALHARIKVLVYQVGLEEKELLQVLQREGFNIQPRTLKYVRHSLGIFRRVSNPITAQAQVESVLSHLRTALASGQIEGYGRKMLHQHIRSQGFMISRDRLFGIYRDLAPHAVRRRLQDLQRHRGAYIVPGPNFIWSIDGYLKLAPYGIEIYAAIDAYSRYVIWIYVGISSRTAVSVLRQFLDTLQITQQQPRFVRSDRGTETVLLAEAQHKLQKSLHPEIPISDCYLYGTSTANQRIEAWWLQLTRSIIFRYRIYFHSLQEEGHYSRDTLSDQIALYAIYMPLLRVQITSFVRTWNNHHIRKQRNRPHLVTGRPFMNYNFPAEDIQDYGLQFDPELLQALQDDVRDWDADEYLPTETYNWTLNQLLQLDFDPRRPPESAGGEVFIPFRTVYLELRSRIKAHIQAGSTPNLGLSQRPIGAFDWNPESSQEAANNIEEIEVEYDQEEIGVSLDSL
ncbi:uncharacterized protein BDV17DRAFT_252101, partial [Aspergillus undulatus]|uniref:uncharacterized protein n=1 Tax=Aspergillus undulatus TaxID=1810928 RepID=UPI003CCE260B